MRFLYKFEAMTTPCEVLLLGVQKSQADRAAQAILKEAKRLERKYNYFRLDSYLSKINSRENDLLDMETRNLLQRAMKYYRQTQKVFDITIATIKDIYRTSDTLQELQEAKVRLLPYTGCEHIALKRDRIVFDNPYTKIDLGGFVKEYAVDQAVKILRKHKIEAALVNFGGDIYALGKKPDGRRFRVGIKNPENPEMFTQFVEIENQALTTSASYERNVRIEGKLFSHILAKETFLDTPRSVTVISPNCVESGVFSTALMIKPDIETKNRVIML